MGASKVDQLNTHRLLILQSAVLVVVCAIGSPVRAQTRTEWSTPPELVDFRTDFSRLTFTLEHASRTEQTAKVALEPMARQYNLAELSFNDRILVDDDAAPETGFATVGTRRSGDLLLSSYVHQQVYGLLASSHSNGAKTFDVWSSSILRFPQGRRRRPPNETAPYAICSRHISNGKRIASSSGW